MIRRQVDNEFWLITQDDHARLSGELARQFGGRGFPAPSSPAAIMGIELHDCGWPLHDDKPTLNRQHQPLDVFETPRSIAIPVWERSVEIAMARDPFAGLLVSLHVFGLSIFAVEQGSNISSSWNMNEARARFDINRFQHRMIEVQETLRQQLGMRTDRPLLHGISEDLTDPAESRLKNDFQCLRCMDQLSLSICCTKPPFAVIEPRSIRVERTDHEVRLDPWPFAPNQIEASFAFRRLPAKEFADDAELRELFFRTAPERFTVQLRPSRI